MLTWLQLTLVGLALLIGVVALVYVVLDRAIDPRCSAWRGALASARSSSSSSASSCSHDRAGRVGASFVGYLLGLVLVPPLGAFWALGERSRAGTVVLVLLGVVVPVLLLRLDQIWTASVV